jgi:hypothetical protein
MVCVPTITIPSGPALIFVPSIVIAEPPGDSVNPSMRIVSPVLEPARAVIVLPPKVKTACEVAIAVGTDSSSEKGIVREPSTTSPAVPTLSCVPSTVIAEPPGDKMVPSTTTALPVPVAKMVVRKSLKNAWSYHCHRRRRCTTLTWV